MEKKMIKNKDVLQFLTSLDSTEYKATFKKLSQGSNGYLVDSEALGYNFDKIKSYLLHGDKLKSADALTIKDDSIYFIEFKTGFEKRISDSNFDYSKWKCDATNDFCEQGSKYFKMYQKSTLEVYKLSNFAKLLESFLIFEKFILPNCNDTEIQFKLKYIVVVDAVKDEPVDAIETILYELGNINNNSNRINQFKRSIKKYQFKDSTGQYVLYDDVDVFMKEQFEIFFSCA